MSWYSDHEKYNEKPDPWYCKNCTNPNVSAEVCRRCTERHEEEECDEDE